MQSAACNALHSLEQRACKWMLMSHDRVFTDTFRLTHEFLALMLGPHGQRSAWSHSSSNAQASSRIVVAR